MSFLDRDDPNHRLAKVRAFELVLALIMLTEYWARAIPRWGELSAFQTASLAVGSLLCAAAVWIPLRRLAFAGLGLSHALVVYNDFPATGNHAYLEVVLCLLCATLDARREQERVLFLRAVKWLVFVIFFYSGLQKLVHGYYFHGQYLAFSVWIETFRPLLGLLLPPDEFRRLLSYSHEVGQGPYLVDSLTLLVVSNGTYLAEMAIAFLLLWPRTRTAGAVAAIAFMIAIEIAAREVFFGLIVVSSVLLFFRSDLNRRLVGPTAAALVYLLLVRTGVLPGFTFY